MMTTQLMHFQPSLPNSAREKWICIYPCYLNSRRTRERGRKLSIEQSVENPKQAEVIFILAKLSLDYATEVKIHPREIDVHETTWRWRVRVRLKNDDGTPANEEFPNRNSLLKYIGKTIPVVRARRSNTSNTGPSDTGSQGKKNKKKKK